MAELSKKQLQFCKEYIIDLNATQAAIRAGYSKKTAQPQSSRLLLNVIIAKEIQRLFNERSERTKITTDMVLKELANIAFLDPGGMYDENGNMYEVSEMPEEIRRAIGGITSTSTTGKGSAEYSTKNIKLVSKERALEMLGRHLVMFADKKININYDREEFKGDDPEAYLTNRLSKK